MEQKIKMLGIDMDGTLLTQEKALTERSRKALIKAIEQGIEIVLATGRPESGIPDSIREIPEIRYAVTSNGARILDIRSGELLHQITLSKEKAKELLEVFRDFDSIPGVNANGQGYLNQADIDEKLPYFVEPPMLAYILSSRKGVKDIWEIVEQNPEGIEKVQDLFRTDEDQAEARRRVDAIPGVKAVSSAAKNLEVSSSETNKAGGLLYIAGLLGIRPEEIMTFGDNDNDLDMLKMAGMGVAMGNAIPELKEVADYVTLSNEEDGVAAAIERLILREREK